ncbi:bile acid:sodium symporter [Cerasicoccus maritimus]|uniref:bile acid:sodium symporter n=1 Tax=Cerasicoccus maritimus TaxID=490089 RepID=UPI00285266EF|nr:bile acid:sodium symporter [Cerasicoccus maritimus]
MVRFVMSNQFIVGVFVAALLAGLYPEGAAEDSWLFPQYATKVGVFIIFLLQGMILPTEELSRGLSQWKVHVFTQCYIFIVMPIIAWLVTMPLTGIVGPALSFGWLYLGIIPCTISTSVVYTTKSGGSMIVSLFNTSVANVIGIFIVPAFYIWYTGTNDGGTNVPLGEMLFKIFLLLLLPLMLGQGIRPFAHRFIDRYKHIPSKVCPYIIYSIIYFSFAKAVLNRFWEKQPPLALAVAALGIVLIAVVGWSLCALLLKAMPFKREDKIAAFYCSTQKTVAAGVPMAQSLMIYSEWDAGMVLLPLLLYCLFQFSVGGVIVGKLAAKNAPQH